MERQEKIFLAVLFVAIVALVLFQRKEPPPKPLDNEADPVDVVGMSITPETTNLNTGPAYLVSNAPYLAAPPVFNVMPTSAWGNIAGVIQNLARFMPKPDKPEEG